MPEAPSDSASGRPELRAGFSRVAAAQPSKRHELNPQQSPGLLDSITLQSLMQGSYK